MKIAKTMKKAVCALAASGMFLLCGFDSATFELDDLKNYQREFQSESIGTCSTSSVKTYEDYRGISNTGSTQYRYIHDHMTVDETTGLLMDEDGFIGAALGYQYGEIGSRYYFVLDTGIVIPIVKVDAKASADAPDGCTAGGDASVIEFVIDSDKAAEYFGQGSSGLVAMRQAALIVILAQMGCYVPAKSCTLPLFDKIFTRIGASDDILSGQSTFMVEMSEANRALSEATEHSLILFDEIGRGTSTYDGMALAQAMIEYIAACIHAKTLFSTHYHELTSLEDTIDCVKNIHVMLKEENGEITFLYKVKDGRADKSYGINVARLAGLPDSVLSRAKELLAQLESKRRVVQQSYQLVEMKSENTEADQIRETLKSVDPDDLSPKQAWQLIQDLSEKAKERKE